MSPPEQLNLRDRVTAVLDGETPEDAIAATTAVLAKAIAEQCGCFSEAEATVDIVAKGIKQTIADNWRLTQARRALR